MPYVFYDTETTGIEPAFDQIIQFAAIYTNDDFQEIERLEIRSCLLPHIVASPMACRVNGVSVAMLDDPELPSHYGMIRTIVDRLKGWSPSVFIGYNSIKFDESIFRQALYQTLHSPYLTNSGGNCRSDVMRMAYATAVFAPGALVFPINEKGRPSFKLDRLAPANGFTQHNAHDALGDVEATIFICRLIAERAPKVWSSFRRFSRKAAAERFMVRDPIWWLTEIYGGRPITWLVSAFGRNPDNPSELCVVDLTFNPDELASLNDVDLAVRLAKSPKPIRWVKSNACPIIMPWEDGPEGHVANTLGKEEILRRSARYRKDRALAERLVNAQVESREMFSPSAHVEQQIYDGFFTAEDQELMAAFHESPWDRRVEIAGRFIDARLRKLALRLIFFEKPEVLPLEFRDVQHLEMSTKLLSVEDDIRWLTLPAAVAQTEDMMVGADEASLAFLNSYKSYLTERLNALLASVRMRQAIS
ncbi:MAG: exodeoxyribonuclease I [Chloroflexi bacterium]|nr:exodeoxyribonuclease I [Chloroflexota bacterium]